MVEGRITHCEMIRHNHHHHHHWYYYTRIVLCYSTYPARPPCLTPFAMEIASSSSRKVIIGRTGPGAKLKSKCSEWREGSNQNWVVRRKKRWGLYVFETEIDSRGGVSSFALYIH